MKGTDMLDPFHQIIKIIRDKLQEKDSLLIAIDGRCASGKTTMADKLQKALNCNCIHMDDFFLQPMQRTPQRLKEPGGNVDYERFTQEVLIPLKGESPFSFRPFLCSSMDFGKPIMVEPNPVTIIEGSYACHPNLISYYDLRIFLSIDEKEQMKRIQKRNGLDASKVFQDKWIPLEEAYFAAYQVSDQCDLNFS